MLFFMHFTGTMDHWDSALTDGFPEDRGLVRKLILVGSVPTSREGTASLTPEAEKIFGSDYDPADEFLLRVFVTPSEGSQAAGRKYLEQQRTRKEIRL